MDLARVGSFEVRAIATPGHASHHNVYQWEDNVFGGDVAGVRLGGGPPVPPFVPPELHIESWQESIDKIRALKAKKLYLPHFGLVEGPVSAHLDALSERIDRWAVWFRDRIRGGQDELQLTSAFAENLARELREEGATEGEIRGLRMRRSKLHGGWRGCAILEKAPRRKSDPPSRIRRDKIIFSAAAGMDARFALIAF